MIEEKAKRTLVFLESSTVGDEFEHRPDDQSQKDRIARIASQDHQTHGDEHIIRCLERDHVCVQQTHSAIVEGGNSIECAHPPARWSANASLATKGTDRSAPGVLGIHFGSTGPVVCHVGSQANTP